MRKVKIMISIATACVMLLTLIPPTLASATVRLAMKIVEPTHVYSAVYDFYLEDSVAWVRPSYNGKYGFVNKSGQLISEVEYDEIGGGGYSSEYISVIQGAGMVPVRKGTKWGFVDIMTGQLVIDCKYDSWGRNYSSDTFVRVVEGENTSYINKVGDSYDSIGNRNEGYIAVKKGNEWGFANETTGKLLIECQYYSDEGFESNYGFTFQNGVAVVRKGAMYGLIDKSGAELTEFKYSYMGNFYSSEIDLVRIGTDWNEWLWGAINKTGQEIIPCEYFDLTRFNDDDLAIAGKGTKYGVIDIDESIVVPFDYERISEFNDDVAAAQKDGSYGVINKGGDVVVDFQYSDMSTFSDGLAIVQQGHGNWGIIDKTGAYTVDLESRSDLNGYSVQEFRDGMAVLWNWQSEERRIIGADLQFITDDSYETVGSYGDGFYDVLINGEWKYVSKNGDYYDLVLWTNYDDIKIVQQGEYYGLLKDNTPVTQCDYYSIWDSVDRQFVVRQGELCGVIDSDGNQVLPIEYDYIEPFRSDIQFSNIQKDGFSGLVNREWNIVLPCSYDSIGNLYQTNDGVIATAGLGNQYGVINQAGTQIIPFGTYDHISYAFNNGVASVRKDLGYDESIHNYRYEHGFINTIGTEVVPCIYDETSNLHANLVWVKKDGKWGIYEFLGDASDRKFLLSATPTRTASGYDVTIGIFNTDTEQQKSVLVAIYGESGELLGMSQKEDAFASGQNTPFSLSINTSKNGALLKCFVWDSIHGIQPYDPLFEKKILD